ncbi:conserved hypothetical protein [Perkinsus marinus ATCC 50983]|uniref:Protein kinase domain-containing protein n=1 Tax=Perkinsus marinus (strain ATCC 50983 / TXsc) TaxID=423536 RepID=C5M0V6_PERM5|nr:conserved hypothetical protein [Perkinsus marinus ATCC 50983]EEQ97464.1 conserved hypothetical protein [Perkinsus marinus ATCC 50983]|eukprot:XP_002764747.1 conserved hypothetical protein [Perkinsus marinus ATCC 50983]
MLHNGSKEDSGGMMLTDRPTPGFCAGYSRRRARSFDEDPIEVPNVERLWSQTPIEEHAVAVEGMPSAGDFFIRRTALAGCPSPPEAPFRRDFSKDRQSSPGARLNDPGATFRVAIPSIPLSQFGPRWLRLRPELFQLSLIANKSDALILPFYWTPRVMQGSDSDASMPAWAFKRSKANARRIYHLQPLCRCLLVFSPGEGVAQTPHTHILTNQKVLKHPPASVRLQRMLLERGGREFPAPTVYSGHEVKRRRIGRASDYSRLHDEFRRFKRVGEGSFAEMLAMISHSADLFGPETSAMASHITRYFGCWFEDDQLHIQTELCEESLTAEIKRSGRLSYDKLTVVLRDISSALKFLHVDMHVAHKDVKPDNVLRITTSCYRSKYKLCDFGLATSIHENSEASSDLGSGDARYLPREMLSCHADRPLGNDMVKVDIFSLGASALECGIGHSLAPNGDQWQAIRDGNLPFEKMDQLPSKLTELIKAMLSPAPEARPDAESILAKLNSL